MPRVVVKGAKRVKPGAQRRRLPITPEVLAKLREVWDRCPNGQDAGLPAVSAFLVFCGQRRWWRQQWHSTIRRVIFALGTFRWTARQHLHVYMSE